jgi:single-stranded-DNA-specific exonuclease
MSTYASIAGRMSDSAAHELVGTLLEKRGIPHDEWSSFLSPDFDRDLHSPWLLAGMEQAVDRLIKAKEQRILIFGDYDADGVPATALLMRALRKAGFTEVIGLIPTRHEGYGLTAAAVENILKRKPQLVLTVDNGTVAHEEVATLVAAGCDVIVIDHHEALEGKCAAAALAIINPKVPGSSYPFRDLCACGLAWKVMVALYERLELDLQQLKWELDLVALSTIADMVPLVGENRVLAMYGLRVFRKSRNLGLKALVAEAGVALPSVGAGDIGFKIGPRINATSRMHASLLDGEDAALQLLVGGDALQVSQLAKYLNTQNNERQQLVERHCAEAEESVQLYTDSPVLVAYGESWSTGVIGLVASKLMERYRRPAIALAPEDGVIKGSVRTVDGVNALELLQAAGAQLERYGGHAKAAGLTMLPQGDVDAFRQAVGKHMDQLGLSLDELARRCLREPDGILELSDISVELAEALEQLEPFGIGFPTPQFTLEAEVRNVRKVGKSGNHVSLFLCDADRQCKAIAFSYAGPELHEGVRYRFSVNLQTEEWQQVKSAVCVVRQVEQLD